MHDRTASGTLAARRRLGREIGVVLALKAVALVVLYLLFFGPAHRPDIDARAVEDRLLDTTPGVIHGRDGHV